MDPSIVVALIALIGVLSNLFYTIYKDKTDRNDKKDDAHEAILKEVRDGNDLTKEALKELSHTDLLLIRHQIIEMERTRSEQGFKTPEDEYLWDDLVTRYHWGCKLISKENGVIDQAEYRWKRLETKK